jgi:hypothetical protein
LQIIVGKKKSEPPRWVARWQINQSFSDSPLSTSHCRLCLLLAPWPFFGIQFGRAFRGITLGLEFSGFVLIDLNPTGPLGWDIGFSKNGFDGAFRHASFAVDAIYVVNVEHHVILVETLHRADHAAVRVFTIVTRLTNGVRHVRSFQGNLIPIRASTALVFSSYLSKSTKASGSLRSKMAATESQQGSNLLGHDRLQLCESYAELGQTVMTIWPGAGASQGGLQHYWLKVDR